VFKIDGKVADNYKKRDPVSIIVLKPEEEVHLRAVANLNVSMVNAIYEATTNAIHKEITSTEYELLYETLGQLNKNVIFEKAIKILIKKLECLEKFVKETYEDNKDDIGNIMSVELYGETDTIGYLLTNILQSCEHIERAGYVVPHPFVAHVIIDFQTYKNSKLRPIQVFIKSINYAIKIFNVITKQWIN